MSNFIDEVTLFAKAGDGGNGIVAWRREAHVAKGGPSGGDGGDGGDVIFVADEGVHSLLDYKLQKHVTAKSGAPGRGKRQAGEFGPDFMAKVPIGTQIFDQDTGELLGDLTTHGQALIACRGGSGGFGNTHFTTPSRQAPEFANPGLPGEQRHLRLSLKLMADVGLLGFPNAGKSTFLSRVSAARPKIANYPFTTLVPQLGVVRLKKDDSDHRAFVVADVPGLIEGAADGEGLGIRFLKHLERVRVLLHLIEVPLSVADDNGGDDDTAFHKTRGPQDLVKRYEALRKELKSFSDDLAAVPEVVAINKIDLLDDDALHAHPQVKKLAAKLAKKHIPLLFVSTATGHGVKELSEKLFAAVQEAKLR